MNNTKIQIEHVEVSKLIPYARNSRTHSPTQVKQIAASIREFGFMNPVLIDASNTIIAGHGRVMAAEHLQLQSVPCVRHEHLTEAQRRAYVIADNKLAMNADWDEEMLKLELDDLHMEGFDVGMLGFDPDELSKVMKLDDKEVVEDEIPEPPAEAITKPGDLWLLGEHRLLCGDSTKAEDVHKLFDGAKADLMLTDPPYNVDYTGKTKDALKVANDSMKDADFRQFLIDCFALAFESMKSGASYYVFHADSEGYNFRGAVKDCGQTVRQCLIWVKNSLVMGRQDYQWQHEPCLYGWKDGASHGWYSDRKQTTLLRFDRPTQSTDHPTMKPVQMFAYLLGNSTAPQGLAYDPFLGSGTTLIAAEQLGRKCYGMELSPQYCDVIVKRWETLTGKKAERVSNGQA
jgi:site-specific DNA-methyltransferase (adenine-specific)